MRRRDSLRFVKRLAILLGLGLAVTGTAVAGFSFAGVVAAPHAVADTTITFKGYEYNFVLSASSAPAGVIHFVFINEGTEAHDLAIGGQVTPEIDPGQTATLTETLQPGQYYYACTIGEHASFGMQGQFTVTGAPVTTTAVTTITTGGTTQVVTTTQTTTATTPPPPKVTETVDVREKEFHIYLEQKSRVITWVKPGTGRFAVKNIGKIPHNFVIAAHTSPVLSPGKTSSFVVTLKKGRYKYLCSVPGHAALGMRGTLIVSATKPK